MNRITEKTFCLPIDNGTTKQHLQLNPEFSFVRGNFTDVPPGHSTGWRTMPFHLCTMGMRSDGESSFIEIPGVEKELVTAKEDFLFIPSGIRHRFTESTSGSCHSTWLHFRVTFNNGIDLFSLYDIAPFHLFDEKDISMFRALLRKLIELPQAPGIVDSLQMQIIGITLVGKLLEHGTPKQLPANRNENIRRLQDVLQLLSNSLIMPATAELAKLACLSSSRFLAVFNEVMRESPGQYWQRRRFDKACQLLQEGLSIKEITQQLGFSDASHFSRVFKRFSGMSPGAFAGQCFN